MKTLNDFSWAKVFHQSKNSADKFAFCQICQQVEDTGFWSCQKPKSFLRARALKIRKNGVWEFNRFSKHEQTKAHKYALGYKPSGQKKLSFHIQKLSSSSDKSEDPLKNMPDEFIATVMMLLVEQLSVAKISRIFEFKKKLDKTADYPVSRNYMNLILESFSSVVKGFSEARINTSQALGLLLDDGSAFDAREWQSACIRADSFEESNADKAFLCLYALSRLNFDELNAEGMLKVIKENFSVEILKKIMWVTRDGATVMEKFGRIFAEKCNPFSFSVWCANHRGNLSLKDSIHESQNMTIVLDFLKAAALYFQFSNKSSDVLQEKLPQQFAGQTLKRAENLTRWTGIFAALNSMLRLFPFVVQSWCHEFFAPETQARKKRKIKSLCNQAFDYRMLIRMFVLKEFSACYVKFHEKLQDRKNDFTTLPLALAVLKRGVNKISTAENFAKISVEVMKIVKALREFPRSQELQRKADVDVRLSDFDDHWVGEVTKSECENLLEVFEDSVVSRFDEEILDTVNAFAILDPNTFPNTKVMEEKEKEDFFTNHGIEPLAKLKAWYGEEKGNFGPIVDKNKIDYQWEEFKMWYACQQKLGVKFPSFRVLFNTICGQAKFTAKFANDFSEIIKLFRIAEAKPDSSAECERTFSNLKSILTPHRTLLSDQAVSDLVRVSFETKRHKPLEYEEILQLLPHVKRVLAKKVIDFRNSSAAKMREKRKKPVASAS